MLTTDQVLAAARGETRWKCPCGASLTMSTAWIRNAAPSLAKAALDSWAEGHRHLPGYRPSPPTRWRIR